MFKPNEELALLGGKSIRSNSWPKWPRADIGTERYLLDVLHSGRWAISGMNNGKDLYERQFSDAFARYEGVNYCVPVCNGSASLVIALQALGVDYGSEVLVPGLVWVACASTVARIGAIPILVDIEPETLCMSVQAAREAITERTKAIMLVHLYCGMGDLDAFMGLSNETRLPILEDCSQAHGGSWNGKRVGSFGSIGAFSTQDSKMLTSGEGGITVTDDYDLYSKLQQFRGDGRSYRSGHVEMGHPHLEEVGAVQGHNYCMSEFQAAILLDRLSHLDEENRIRESNAEYLQKQLAEIGDITPVRRLPQVTTATYYHFCVRLNREAFCGLDIEIIRQALMAELNIYMEPVDDPLNKNPIYNPLRSNRTSPEHRQALNPSRFELPNARKAREECLTFPHFALLGDKKDMDDIASAFGKVKKNCHKLVNISS